MTSSHTSTPAATEAIPGPRGLDYLRLVRQLFADPSTALDGLHGTYGPISELRLGPTRIAVIGDPSLLHQMFSMPAESFRWGHKFNMIGVRFVVGKSSMIVSDGNDHHRRRTSVQTAFTRRRLNSWIPMILARTDAALVRVIQQLGTHPTELDLYPVGRNLILGITVHAFFGQRLAERADEIGELYERPQHFIEAPAIKQLPHPFPFTTRSRVRADGRAIAKIIDAEISQRRSHPTGDPFDILEAIVNEGSLSDAEIRDQVKTLIGAGYDTTASALAWILWCAALSPDAWARLRAEADAVLGPIDATSTDPDHSTLAGLEYAQRVVHESLRLHPAGLIAARMAATNLRLGGHLIRKGTLVVWSPHLAGRDPGSWTNPLHFDPDRFADLTPEQKTVSDQAWVPFGRGPHMCIGFALAQMELTLIIARLAQRLDLTPTSTQVPHPIGMVVNRPTGGAPFQVSARNPT
ncbi:MAG: cytochrome P450 [Ilumatobacteraceae bacterium]